MVEPERRSEWITHLWPVNVEHSERIQALREAGGSLPFFSRYVAEEFRDVWMELAALGDSVWLDPVRILGIEAPWFVDRRAVLKNKSAFVAVLPDMRLPRRFFARLFPEALDSVAAL